MANEANVSRKTLIEQLKGVNEDRNAAVARMESALDWTVSMQLTIDRLVDERNAAVMERDTMTQKVRRVVAERDEAHGYSAEGKRPHYLPAPQFFQLNHACTLVEQAFNSVGCYLVGSSLRTKDFRDVDVRLMLEDAEYDRLFRGNGEAGWLNPFWSLQCTTISLWLSKQSGLPIDFQIQRMTQANENHSGKRNALGIFLDYPGERPTDIDPEESDG